MKRGVFCLFTVALMVCGVEILSAQRGRDGVTINGVMWATRNVGAKGKFVKNPQDVGRYYTFEEAKSVCPAGWQTPTAADFDALAGAPSVWTTDGDVNGRRIGSGESTVFFPAAGGRYTKKEPEQAGSFGYYWSSNQYSDGLGYDEPQGQMAYALHFHEGALFPQYHHNRVFGFPVRCVKK